MCQRWRPRAFLDRLVERYPEVEVHAFEVWHAVENRPLLQALSDAFGRPVRAVPVTFIGEDSWIGFNHTASLQVTASVEARRDYDAPDALDRLPPGLRAGLLPEPPPAPRREGATESSAHLGRRPERDARL